MERMADWLTRREHVAIATLPDGESAARAIARLVEEGIPQPRVSLLALKPEATRELFARHAEFDAVVVESPTSLSQEAEGTGQEEFRALMDGAGVGLLLTLALLAAPGFGPAMLAGGPLAIARTAFWLATASGGLGILVGAILDDRGSEEHRAAYQADLERGGWLVAVHGSLPTCELAATLLRGQSPSRLEVF
ncbi:MAG: hypothetical protein VKQ33_08200 [Candidatus Sericytochromatia bacterium]|nr:hypothetical protein [Candidatus Sericytochromatia bacterium]